MCYSGKCKYEQYGGDCVGECTVAAKGQGWGGVGGSMPDDAQCVIEAFEMARGDELSKSDKLLADLRDKVKNFTLFPEVEWSWAPYVPIQTPDMCSGSMNLGSMHVGGTSDYGYAGYHVTSGTGDTIGYSGGTTTGSGYTC